MDVPTKGIMRFLSTLTRDEHLNVIVTQRVKGSVIAGLMAVFGSLILDVIGAVLGGALGGCIAAATCKDFKPVGEILATMDVDKKEHLAERVRQIMKKVGVRDLTVFSAVLTSGVALRNQVLGELIGYLKEEMEIEVVKG